MKKESRQNLPLHDFGCEQVHSGDAKRYSMAFVDASGHGLYVVLNK